jgi:endonuclease III
MNAVQRRRAPGVPEGRVIDVCSALELCYGSPRLGNPTQPEDELVYAMLSSRSSPEIAVRVYQALKARFATWDDFLHSPSKVTAQVLQPAGLWRLRNQQIRRALRTVRRTFGEQGLISLRSWPQDRAEKFLLTLPGVSKKVAKCIMLYTLDFAVLPVDIHVHRISKRLGWTSKNRPDLSQKELEQMVPPDLRYGFHVNCVAHGRLICCPLAPTCDDCCLSFLCPSARGRSPSW